MMATYRSKYHSRKVTVDGNTYDSKKEYKRHCELLLLEKAGAIKDLQRQVRIELIPAQYETFERYGKSGKRLKDGKKCIEKAVCYVADFVYEVVNDEQPILLRTYPILVTDHTVVEDTKGFRTTDYILKRKMLYYFYQIKINEV